MMNWKEFGSKLSWPNFKAPTPEGLKRTTKNLNQDSRSPGQDMNPEPPEYEAEMLTT
jgi:hypothetical protein